MSYVESNCPPTTYELGNMSFLLLEIHSLRNCRQFPYKLCTHTSAREGEFVQIYAVGFSFDKRLEVLICCWYDVGCNEAGMKLKQVDDKLIHWL